MQKILIKILTIWGAILLISACAGRTSPIPAASTHIDNPHQNQTANAYDLYRNSLAQIGGGGYCAACHGSLHAIYPSITARDNKQSLQLQSHTGPIVECVVCHKHKPEEAFWHFGGDY